MASSSLCKRGVLFITNEEIVALIQQGREDLYLTLWEQTKGFVVKLAYNRLLTDRRGFDGRYCPGGAEAEDLVQAGFIALTEAAKTYRPDRAGFLTWFKYYILSAFDEAQGIRTSKREPLDECISLDRPVTEDGDVTIGDRVEADDCLEDVVEKVYRQELRAALEKALDEIPAQQAGIIRETFFDGKTLAACGEQTGTSTGRVQQLRKDGLKQLRYNKGLRAFLADEMNYYPRFGSRQFNTTRSSSTEMLAFRRIQLEEKYAALFGGYE